MIVHDGDFVALSLYLYVLIIMATLCDDPT